MKDKNRQLALPFVDLSEPMRRPSYRAGMTIDERFELFHEANSHVARELAKLALQLKRAGRKRYGMKALFEILRWSYAMQTSSDEPFKLSNDFTACYARLLMSSMPELEDFFVTRERTARGAAS